MNRVTLLGRLTKDPECRYNESGMYIVKFTLAVDRGFKKDAPRECDFINCVAFGKTGEAIGNFFHKGSRILIEGRLQVNSYNDKNGNKKYSTTVVLSSFEFIEKRSESSAGGNAQNYVPFSDVGSEVPDISF